MAAEISSPEQVQTQVWMKPIKEKLNILRERSLKLSIFTVPNKLHIVNQDVYNPLIVSIGSFHSSTTTTPLLQQTMANKDDHLQAMEEHKWWYTFYLIWRTRQPMETLDLFGTAILALDKSVRGTFAGGIKAQFHELAEIMLIDGCFILELFLRSWVGSQETEDGDFIFHNTWMLPTLQRDLTLLENQIPFFILEELYDIVVKRAHNPANYPANQFPSVTQLALSFFLPDLSEEKLESNEDEIRKKYGQEPWKHLLDLLHKFYFRTSPETDPQGKKDLVSNQNAIKEKSSTSPEIEPEGQEKLKSNKKTQGFGKCATELSEAGIVFKKVTRDDLLLAVEFEEGVFKIQQLCIDEKTESLLRNLIAFEQWSAESKQLVSSYVIILKSLVASSYDIELLKQIDIITPNSVEVEKVLTFFNNISLGMKKIDFCLGKLCTDVNNYQNSWWSCHRIKGFLRGRWLGLRVRWLGYMKVLKRDYFSSPWSIISLIAGVVILILTAVQTYYAVRSYSSSQFPH